MLPFPPRGVRGFTIIELLIVIAIIAILASVAIPALLRARKSGQESAALQVLKSIQAAEESHRITMLPPKRYVRLGHLSRFGGCTMREGGLEPTSGYTFTSVAGYDAYTVVAIPPKKDMTTYTLIETGDIFP